MEEVVIFKIFMGVIGGFAIIGLLYIILVGILFSSYTIFEQVKNRAFKEAYVSKFKNEFYVTATFSILGIAFTRRLGMNLKPVRVHNLFSKFDDAQEAAINLRDRYTFNREIKEQKINE